MIRRVAFKKAIVAGVIGAVGWEAAVRGLITAGQPVLQTALPKLMKGLGVAPAGNAIMEWQQFQRWGMHNVEYGTAARKALTIAKPLTAIGLGAAAIFGLTALIGKLRRHEKS